VKLRLTKTQLSYTMAIRARRITLHRLYRKHHAGSAVILHLLLDSQNCRPSCRRLTSCLFQNSRSRGHAHFFVLSSLVPYLCKATDHIGNSGAPKHHHHTNVVRLHASSMDPFAASQRKRAATQRAAPKKAAEHNPSIMNRTPGCRRLRLRLTTSRLEPSHRV
jgi:hypothetical protein